MTKIHTPTGDLNNTLLAKLIEEEAGLDAGQGDRVLQATLDIIGRHVAAGYRVKLTNFGSFFRRDVRIPPASGFGKIRDTELPKAVRRARFTSSGLFADAVRAGVPARTLRKRGKGQVSGS
jgi:nucleoid DNA-binding protein